MVDQEDEAAEAVSHLGQQGMAAVRSISGPRWPRGCATPFLDSRDVNRTVALFLQLIGGAFVLVSIDSNIALLRKKRLVNELIDQLCQYWHDCPLCRRSVVLQGQRSVSQVWSESGALTAEKNPQSVDEKLAYLQKQIEACQQGIATILEELDRRGKDQQGQFGSLSTAVRGVETRFDQVAVGDLRWQILGVVFVFYGALVDFCAGRL